MVQLGPVGLDGSVYVAGPGPQLRNGLNRGDLENEDRLTIGEGDVKKMDVLGKRVKSMATTHHGELEIVDLHLHNTLEDSPEARLPKLTGETLSFDSTAFGKKVSVSEVYFLVGARVFVDVRGIRCVRFPPITENTSSILLPNREDLVVTVMEVCCGGFSAWSRACHMLPAESVLKIDNEGMAVSSTLLNDPRAILFANEEGQHSFNTFWGELVDLRWTAGLHGTDTEIMCCSLPCQAFAASTNAPGFQDVKNTVAWFQFFLVARFLQRRAIILETLPGFARHKDYKLVVELLKWAGYKVVWAGFLDSHGMVPAERQRFFVIAWNNADMPSAGTPFRMMKINDRDPIPCRNSLWDMMPAEVLSTVKLSDKEISLVSSRELLPWYLKERVGSPIHIRMVDKAKPLPIVHMNFRHCFDQSWMVLKKKGIHIPLLYQGGDVRTLSTWELARAFGFPQQTILPDNEEDASTLLGQCLLPCQALVVLASTIAHRQEDMIQADALDRYLEAALTEWEEGWRPFQDLYPINKNGWSMLIPRGDENEMGPRGTLAMRLAGLKVNVDFLMYGRSQGRQPPFYPESTRVLNEELNDTLESNPSTHRLYQVERGYHDIILDEQDTISEVTKKIADFLQVPQNALAISRLTNPDRDTNNWVLVGGIPDASHDKVLVLVDPAIPAAWWMPSEITKKDLKCTYADHHSALPNLVTINDCEIHTWPACIQSGDFIKLRWDHHSEGQAWKELDIFKQFDQVALEPPASPDEGGESSPGGPDEDPPVDGAPPATADTSESDREPTGDPATEAPPATLHESSHEVPPTEPYEVDSQEIVRGMPFHDAPDPKRLCTQESRDLQRMVGEQNVPATINYNAITSQPAVSSAFYLHFQHQIVSICNMDERTLERVIQDEWGMLPHMAYFTVGTKVLGPHTTCNQIAVGASVVVRGRLRGGTGQAMSKLRTILAAKGVPEDQLDSRVQEIKAQIGDKGIKEAYASFDPWAQLKAKCPTRIIRESELKHKPKNKEVQDDHEDPLQVSDPWSQALKERGAWKLDNTFFKLQDGNHPQSLDKLEPMSDSELAALVIGGKLTSSSRFQIKNIETPCKNKDGVRILVRAQLVNFGTKSITLADEASVVTVDEIDASVLSCELVHEEMEAWEDAVDGVVRYLKANVTGLERGLIGTWGRRFFYKSKPTMDAKNAQTCFLMVRVKREFVEQILKQVVQGVYFSPRRDDGALDTTYKVIWFPETSFEELLVRASSEACCYGLVRNKSGYGLRVQSTEFTKLRQKWPPSWAPIEDTPYNIKVQLYFDVQNLPLNCTKTEVQKFVNRLGWKALVLRQTKPQTWTVGAETAPEKLVHLTSHGTVLISEKTAKGKGKGKVAGKGRDGKGSMPWWVAGSSVTPGALLGPQHPGPPQHNVVADQEATEIEDRLQKKLDMFHQEQMASQKILRQDFMQFKQTVEAKQADQDRINSEVSQGILGLKSSLSMELGQHVQNITDAIKSQRSEIMSNLTNSQISLKEELMGEMRTQMGPSRPLLIHLEDYLDGSGCKLDNNNRSGWQCFTEDFVDEGRQAGKRSQWCNSWNSFIFWEAQHCGDILSPPPPWNIGQRIGEAKNPGPRPFTISGINVQSLNAFCDDGRLISRHADVLIFSETAATTFVQQKAKKLAQMAGYHFTGSHPVPKRCFTDARNCVTKGQARGTAIASSLPVRRPFSEWPLDLWESSRVCDSYILTPSGPVLIIAVYGLHQGLEHHLETNEALLRQAALRASLVQCPAVIVGDINCAIEDLTAWQAMQDNGWMDAAICQHNMDGKPVEPTYKNTSRLDYVLLNPLARIAFRNFYLSEQDETDHRSVNASFDWGLIPTTCWTFRTPTDMKQLKLAPAEMEQSFIPGSTLQKLDMAIKNQNVEEAWTLFCGAYENAIDYVLANKGANPLGRAFRGRGQTVFAKKDTVAKAMVASARNGEFQPSGDEDSIMLRQRLGSQNGTYAIQRSSDETWNAICHAPGFQPSFQVWWTQNHTDWFPVAPPPTRMAKFMRDELVKDEAHWRNVHRSNKARHVSAVFDENWKQGGAKFYKAIRPPGMPRVDSLNVVSDHRIQARRSRRKGCQICSMLDDELQLVKVGVVWKQGKASAYVTSIRDGKVFLKPIKGCFVTGTITQCRPSANPLEILQSAEDYWSDYWNNYKDVEVSSSQVQDAISSLPQLEQMQFSFTDMDLQWALSALPMNKARGMDGFSNYEVKHLPLLLRPYLVRLFNLFAQGHWPDNLCKARMALLYKTQEVGGISSTRPITILATVYRIWAKIATRKMMQHILPSLPETLFGSVPGRSAADMTSRVQLQLEKCLLQDEEIAGISLDFSKAYNTLPREYLQKLNDRLGLSGLWQTYSSFLGGLQRFFTCGHHWGKAIKSKVGVPEGCPIAVVQMIILTWSFTNLVKGNTGVPMHTYVDDWMLLSKNILLLKDSVLAIDALAQKLGLILSLQKSSVFATSTKLVRQALGLFAHHGIKVGQSKNMAGLGINFQTAKVASLDVRNHRWIQAKTILDRLQYMPWSVQKKTDIICRAVMPLVFYGVEHVFTGKDFLREVRAKFNHTVWGKKQYHIHYLAPVFSGTCYEPLIYSAKRRFRAMLRSLVTNQQQVMDNWLLSCRTGSYFKRKTRGAVSIFQNQLHGLGWAFMEDGTCTTPRGWTFKIWDITTSRFDDALQVSWEDTLLQFLRPKQNLDDLSSISLLRSQFPRSKDPLLEGFMKKVRLGGMFPNKRLCHWKQEVDERCDYCGQLDTMYHRVFHCPATEHHRTGKDWEYHQALDALDGPDVTQIHNPDDQTLHFFTDGSAVFSECPIRRLCSWAVTLATPHSHENTPIHLGVLPGRKQTVFRAELFAVNTAIASALNLKVFCDNESVVRDVNDILHFGYRAHKWNTHPDRDLLRVTAALLHGRDKKCIQVIWAKAHRDVTDAAGALDLWQIYHNNCADRQAGRDQSGHASHLAGEKAVFVYNPNPKTT
ncbi:unnamed protein product [Symbiodinium sp. CCMP2592]|nr:unnamed protein product [Symbiodinium sp. CCMP2592]